MRAATESGPEEKNSDQNTAKSWGEKQLWLPDHKWPLSHTSSYVAIYIKYAAATFSYKNCGIFVTIFENPEICCFSLLNNCSMLFVYFCYVIED